MGSLTMKLLHCFYLLLFLLFSPSPWANPAIPSVSGQAVTMTVYYETLCPYCADFIVNHLAKVFQDGLLSILHLRLVPFGNTVARSDGTYICQHGSDECFFNTMDACTIAIYPDVARHLRFIYCLERLIIQNQAGLWITCLQTSGLDYSPIACYNNGLGKKLIDNYAAETSRLNPPQKFVPWVIVNDQPLEEDFKNFVWYVCKAYKGIPVPDACIVSAETKVKMMKANKSNSSVCFPSKLTSGNKVYFLPNSTY